MGVIVFLSVLLLICILVCYCLYRFYKYSIKQKDKALLRYRIDSDILYQWLALKQKNIKVTDYFDKIEARKIVIYGMGEMGNRLYEELKANGFEIPYVIDQSGVCSYDDVEVRTLADEIDGCDVIVISLMFAYDTICDQLTHCTNAKMISINEVVFGISGGL